MILIIICAVIVVLAIVAGYLTSSDGRTQQTPSSEVLTRPISTLHYESAQPHFSFDYPNLDGYSIATGTDYIHYDFIAMKRAGPSRTGVIGAYISWNKIYIKVAADYWDQQKVNGNGVQYNLSQDENTLDFRLAQQGSVVRFDVRLQGSYNRKKLIIDAIINSFKEEGNVN